MAESRDSMGARALPTPSASSVTHSVPEPLQALAIDAAKTAYGETVTASPSQIEAARKWLPSAEIQVRAASEQHRIAILLALADVVGKPDVLRGGSTAEIARFWMAYHADLGHLPAAVLSRACASHRRSGERWYPTPGQFLAYVREDEDWKRAAAVAAGLRRLVNARARRSTEPLTADEEAAIEAKWQAFQQRNKALRAQAVAEHDTEISAAKEWATGPRPWETKPKQTDAA